MKGPVLLLGAVLVIYGVLLGLSALNKNTAAFWAAITDPMQGPSLLVVS